MPILNDVVEDSWIPHEDEACTFRISCGLEVLATSEEKALEHAISKAPIVSCVTNPVALTIIEFWSIRYF